MKNGCFTHHVHPFKTGCLEFQDDLFFWSNLALGERFDHLVACVILVPFFHQPNQSKINGWKIHFFLGWHIFKCELLVSGSVPNFF